MDRRCVRTVSIIDHIVAGVFAFTFFLVTFNHRRERGGIHCTRNALGAFHGYRTVLPYSGVRQQAIIKTNFTNRPERITP